MKEIVVPRNTILWCEDTLAAHQEAIVDVEPLRVEASHRCFYRVHTDKRSVVLMDSPPHLERNQQFAALSLVFQRNAIPVAAIVAQEDSKGLFLLEDLGDTHLEDVYATELRDHALTAAIDLLPQLAQVTDPAIEPYTSERLFMELDIFDEWFMGKLLGLEVYAGVYQTTSRQLVETIEMQPKCCTHRDYHCRNLLYNHGRLGVVDFQDALHGPILYDIASLLRDCYYEFPEAEVTRWLDYFITQTPQLMGIERATVETWFNWTAIQRQLKAVGIFARMYLRDGKATHLGYILPLLQRIQTVAQGYAELRSLVEQLNGCKKAADHILSSIR